MELTNEIYSMESLVSDGVMQEALQGLSLLLSPFAPHLSEELWQMLGREGPVLDVRWPVCDPDLAREDSVQIVVQINGKLRDRLRVPKGLPKEQLSARARETERIRALLAGKTVRNVDRGPRTGWSTSWSDSPRHFEADGREPQQDRPPGWPGTSRAGQLVLWLTVCARLAAQGPGPLLPVFTDVTETSGVEFRNASSGTSQKYHPWSRWWEASRPSTTTGTDSSTCTS